MKKILYSIVALVFLTACESDDGAQQQNTTTTFKFTHNWDGTEVTNADFNTIQYTNANGEFLSIERLRYIISNITLVTSSNETLSLNGYNFVDVTNATNLYYRPITRIPMGTYNLSFTFGLNNIDNAQNFTDLNSASFNVPDMLGGGYHYMQFDGKFMNSNMQEQGFNYHVIRAVDNSGANPTFPQDTFFTVNLGTVEITGDAEVEIKMNIAEWFKTPNTWDLNQLNQMLMPNSTAQIMMYQNGQNVFSLGEVTQ